MESVNSWKEIIFHSIVHRGASGEQTFNPFISGQNIKVSCLEIYNERNLDYDSIDKCINKLHQADDQFNEILSKLTKF